MKDFQATGDAFSPQKRTLSTSNHESSLLFSIFVGHFCPADQNRCGSMRIRIRTHNTGIVINFKHFFFTWNENPILGAKWGHMNTEPDLKLGRHVRKSFIIPGWWTAALERRELQGALSGCPPHRRRHQRRPPQPQLNLALALQRNSQAQGPL